MRPKAKAQKKSAGHLLCWLSLAVAMAAAHAEDATYLYTVQISAQVQPFPAQITLRWEPDQYGVNGFAVYRKDLDETTWGSIANLAGSALSFVDGNVVAGRAYEYQVVKSATLGYTGYGYIYSGIQVPLVESRGSLILIVETNATPSLAGELARLEADLIGDGWLVLRHGVSSNNSPESVKAIINGDYNADPRHVKAVFLFGHVPVLQSGYLNYDGHLTRSMPADAFYGDMDGDWHTDLDPTNRPSFLPSDVELMVGRVDFYAMPGNGAVPAWPSETALLRNYLNKDHDWRHKIITAPRRALMGNLRGDEGGEATAASGYRNFEPIVGSGNTVEANVEYGAPPELRWISMLNAGSYLWAYGCGAGQPTAVSGLGTNDGTFYDVTSRDVVSQDAHAAFVMLFGSWFGQWDFTDDLMRSFLATPTLGLTCCLAGRPHWFCHHAALGEPLGFCARLSMNNSALYQNQSNAMTRAVYIALMGDPALRVDQVAPPSNLTAAGNSSAVNLTWTASSDAIAGYHVYRAATPGGPFSRLTPSLLAGTSFTDTAISAAAYSYMVRAVASQTTPSGSYYNPSQGIFASINLSNAITLQAARSVQGLQLSWNSISGAIYHVEARSTLSQPWADASGPLTATAAITSWTDPDIHAGAARLYRVSMAVTP